MVAVAALTFSTLDTLTRNLLNDNINFVATSPDSLSAQTWDEDMMAEALNFAVKEYCRATDVTYVETSIAVDTSSLATIPDDRLELQRVKYPGDYPPGYTVTITPLVATLMQATFGEVQGKYCEWAVSITRTGGYTGAISATIKAIDVAVSQYASAWLSDTSMVTGEGGDATVTKVGVPDSFSITIGAPWYDWDIIPTDYTTAPGITLSTSGEGYGTVVSDAFYAQEA